MSMRTIILSAGRGQRLRPLTDQVPKPMVEVGGRPMIDHHLQRLAAAGFETVIINTSHLATQIHDFVGDGSRWGVEIIISHEGPEPLETGGGMLHALARLGPGPFLAVNADIVTDYPFTQLRELHPGGLAHLVMVPNPDWRDHGDFALHDGIVTGWDRQGLTFSGIGVYRPELFSGSEPGIFSIVPLIADAMAAGQVTGERYDGLWHDTGTPERLEHIRQVMAPTIKE